MMARVLIMTMGMGLILPLMLLLVLVLPLYSFSFQFPVPVLFSCPQSRFLHLALVPGSDSPLWFWSLTGPKCQSEEWP